MASSQSQNGSAEETVFGEDEQEPLPFSFVHKRSNSIVPVDPSYQPKYLTKFGRLHTHVEDLDGFNKVLVLHTGGTIGMRANREGVYVPIIANSFVPELRKIPMFHDSEYDADIPEEFLLLKRSSGTPIIYTVYEYDPLLDSCNMTMDDWRMLAKDIERNYTKFDGFVILHGTDTMAYTASALAFMLENLGKPVILTGAQIPIFEPRSDGRDNFLGALIIAGQYLIPEVCLYFNATLLRGCRSTKTDNESFAAFSSPNLKPLAEVGIDITVQWNDVFQPYSTNKFTISTTMNPNVGVLRLFPSISAQTVHLFLQPPMQGVALQSFGAGNGPSSRKDIFKELKEATDRGVIIVNITQCSRGAVKLSYETGAALAEAGIIAGSDMTPEAALTKLAYVLGKDVGIREKKTMMSRNLRGELRTARKEKLTLSAHSLVEKVAQLMSVSSGEEVETIRDVLYPTMMCAAARAGNTETLKQLLDTGGTVSAHTDQDGRTPLHIAATEGKIDTVRFLLLRGALVHVRDRAGYTPLLNAIYYSHEDVVKLLVSTGAHLTVPKTKLGSVLYRNGMDERLDRLRCWALAGADLNTTNREGRTIVHAAAVTNSHSLLDLGLELGLDLCVLDIQGLMPAEIAENAGHLELAKRLRDEMGSSESDSPRQSSAEH